MVGRLSEIKYGLIAAVRGAFKSWRLISLNRIVNAMRHDVICVVYKNTHSFIHNNDALLNTRHITEATKVPVLLFQLSRWLFLSNCYFSPIVVNSQRRTPKDHLKLNNEPRALRKNFVRSQLLPSVRIGINHKNLRCQHCSILAIKTMNYFPLNFKFEFTQ